MQLSISPARPDEMPFVQSAWKKSAVDACIRELAERMQWMLATSEVTARDLVKGASAGLYAHFNDQVDNTLASPVQVLVARDPSDESFAYGWMVTGLHDDVFAVHYSFTKHRYRQHGVMTALLRRVLDLVPDDARAVYTARSARDAVFSRYGFEFEPDVARKVRRSA